MVIDINCHAHTLSMTLPVNVHHASAVLTAQFQARDIQSHGRAQDIAETYNTAMGQIIWHMTCTDIVSHQQSWRPEQLDLYQATAYGLLITSKRGFRQVYDCQVRGGRGGEGEELERRGWVGWR